MNSSKKFISHIFAAVLLGLFFNLPDLAMGLVFDRVAAKVNSEIITLSSVHERVEVLKQKYQNYTKGNLLMLPLDIIHLQHLHK